MKIRVSAVKQAKMNLKLYMFGMALPMAMYLYRNTMAEKMEEKVEGIIGFWDVTSNVDWCEKNYVVSFYIVEFW